MLSLSIHHLGDVAVFRCAGRITAEDGDELRAAVLSHNSIRTAVLDLAEVNGVDAAGLGMLLSLRAWAKTSRRQLKLMNLTPMVEEVLEITRLKPEFDICSVHEMLDLLCRAIDQTRLANLPAAIAFPDLMPEPVPCHGWKH